MSETIAIWLGAVAAWGSLLLVIIGAYALLVQRIAILETNSITNDTRQFNERRLAKLETLVEVWTLKAAKIMHSPHTPEIDSYLEKMIAKTMRKSDWESLMRISREIEDDKSKPKEERALAAAFEIVSREELGLPLGEPHKHTDDNSQPS